MISACQMTQQTSLWILRCPRCAVLQQHYNDTLKSAYWLTQPYAAEILYAQINNVQVFSHYSATQAAIQTMAMLVQSISILSQKDRLYHIIGIHYFVVSWKSFRLLIARQEISEIFPISLKCHDKSLSINTFQHFIMNILLILYIYIYCP